MNIRVLRLGVNDSLDPLELLLFYVKQLRLIKLSPEETIELEYPDESLKPLFFHAIVGLDYKMRNPEKTAAPLYANDEGESMRKVRIEFAISQVLNRFNPRVRETLEKLNLESLEQVKESCPQCREKKVISGEEQIFVSPLLLCTSCGHVLLDQS